MDRKKLSWAKVGDIVQVRPEEDDGTTGRREGEDEDRSKAKKRKRKGNYLFKIEENDEGALKRLNTWVSHVS